MYSPSPGVVYPTLTRLEELGYVVGTPVGIKREYTLISGGLCLARSPCGLAKDR
jgi:DNA-binding PadR family transcriptional regulator